MLYILTGSINSSWLSTAAGAELTGNDNCYKGNGGCGEDEYDVVIPAQQTQRLIVIVTGNAPVTTFSNMAQSELNPKYI
jgi:hypothetical protein